VYRNVGFYQDKLLREKLKLCQYNINKEAKLEKRKIGNKKIILQKNQLIKQDQLIKQSQLIKQDQLIKQSQLIKQDQLIEKNQLIKQNQPQKISVEKSGVNDNKFTIIKDNLEKKTKLPTNLDLLKKQNNIKVENTLNQVQKPLNKDITKENPLQEYKHSINTDTKQNEIKEINKIRNSYDQTKNNSSNKKEIIIEIFMKDKEEIEKSNKREQVIEIFMNDTNKKELKTKNDTNKKYDVLNKDSFENPNELKLDTSISNNKKEIIRPKDENVKVLDISPINKTEEKSNNNQNLYENDITDLFDNDEIQDILVEVLTNNKVDELSIDEMYAEAERILFEKVIGPKSIKGKFYKVKKYLKIFAVYILPIILSSVSISLIGLQLSGIMATHYMDAALITAGKTTLVQGTQCLVNAATGVMNGITSDVLPNIGVSNFSFGSLFSSVTSTFKSAVKLGTDTINNALDCVTDDAVTNAVASATSSATAVVCMQIFYPIGIAINVAIIIYMLTKIIVELNDRGKFDKFHKYRKKFINKLKMFNRKVRTKITNNN
ncbi:Plasmodium exported protein, unknown function, partial [Plasmodium chabaudi adami]